MRYLVVLWWVLEACWTILWLNDVAVGAFALMTLVAGTYGLFVHPKADSWYLQFANDADQ